MEQRLLYLAGEVPASSEAESGPDRPQPGGKRMLPPSPESISKHESLQNRTRDRSRTENAVRAAELAAEELRLAAEVKEADVGKDTAPEAVTIAPPIPSVLEAEQVTEGISVRPSGTGVYLRNEDTNLTIGPLQAEAGSSLANGGQLILSRGADGSVVMKSQNFTTYKTYRFSVIVNGQSFPVSVKPKPPEPPRGYLAGFQSGLIQALRFPFFKSGR